MDRHANVNWRIVRRLFVEQLANRLVSLIEFFRRSMVHQDNSSLLIYDLFRGSSEGIQPAREQEHLLWESEHRSLIVEILQEALQ